VDMILVALLGAIVGLGAGRAHPATNPGILLSLVSGALGGWLSAIILGPALAPTLGESALAGATAASVMGAVVLTLIVGAVWNRLRRPKAEAPSAG